jgi:CubicO group peptidase (beta-lactamase class C family)
LAARAEEDRFSAIVDRYMSTYDVPGLGIAYCKGRELLFVGNYGVADRRKHIQLESKHLFRIASISKSITSVAIFKLIESGDLSLSQTVFGRDGVLKEYYLSNHSGWLEQITVHHLLTHTSGGWRNEPHDPMLQNLHLNRTQFLQRTLDEFPLNAPPGYLYAYSNFGYYVLGRVIERCSKKAYEQFVQEVVLQPAGIRSMKLGKTKQTQDEVRYYGQGQIDPYSFPIELHDSCGGWLANPSELARFGAAVFSTVDNAGAPPLLQPGTIVQMTQSTNANPGYAAGWSVDSKGVCFHSGGIEGTASFLVHAGAGFSWAIVVNTRRDHSNMEKDLHQLSWDIERSVIAG